MLPVIGGRAPELLISVPSACQMENPLSICVVPTIHEVLHIPTIGSLPCSLFCSLTKRSAGDPNSLTGQPCRFSVAFPGVKSPHPAFAVAVIMATSTIAPNSTDSFLSVFILRSPLPSNMQGCCSQGVQLSAQMLLSKASCGNAARVKSG